MTLLRFTVLIGILVASLPAAATAAQGANRAAGSAIGRPTELERGFQMLYELKFGAARRQFDAWQGDHPDDPLGAVSMAASYLFVEFYCQRVLTSDYFLDDDRLLHGIKGKPDAVRSSGFRKANQRAMELARSKLAAGTSDTNALLALTLATGMQADYESILEKRQMESLHLIKEAEDYAKRLLALKPDMADAWLALGAANYIIGCLPLHVRFFLWFGGIRGDRRLGMEQLRMTAEYGHYLKPFAKILLALASMREKQYDLAREQLVDLASEFPDNYLFRAELARLRHRDGAGPAASYTQEGRSAVCGCDRQYSLTRGGFEKASGARIFWPLRRNPLLSLE